MAAGNIERFNVLVGAIFAKLYQEFPVAIELHPEDFQEQLAVNRPEPDVDDYDNRRDGKFFVSTVLWLSNHDYLDCGSHVSTGAVMDCVMTARTLELLKAMPSNLESKDPSLGDQLISATKDGMTGKVKELASEFLTKAVVFGTKAATDWVG
ncbi:hypothetical protein [Pseudomonas sp. PB106]|uniref:hypothetical protein n=1 Tax=Pseudomonas sp. PB106 TaxID=2494699 RepID=UPI00131D37CA|nr:hypothetical protein [Pseudomonas sp. PB106]KAE9641953.1 hypothetical protein EJA71_20080 [Pseudomonas sp. PB106]